MTRKQFQTLSKLRQAEAKALFKAKLFHGAYYLAGYSVECALKACIAKKMKKHDVPDRQLVNDSYTHNLRTLLELSGLAAEMGKEVTSRTATGLNWVVVKDWSEHSRYVSTRSSVEAKDMLTAISRNSTGVLSWVRKRW